MKSVTDKSCKECGGVRFVEWKNVGWICQYCDDFTDYDDVGGCVVIGEEQ